METNLLDRMLTTYLTEQTAVTVTLQNKIHVSGKIKAFDGYVIIMEGQKREILYRHAIATLSIAAQEEQKRQPAQQRPAAGKATVAPHPKPQKSSARKNQPMHQQPSLSASPSEPINSSMKDGLLKWMQEQKAAK
ncbi:MAG TPA: RNA chaperone Hfq [Nitrospirota bacterium]|nr:RNA chaperone Hfq [Nitrospirota bacterium]